MINSIQDHKNIAKQQAKINLSKVRNNLGLLDRAFSYIINSKFIDKVSSIAEKSFVRPIPFLGGLLVSLILGISAFYLSKHIGFKLPNCLFAVLFAIGYVLGLVIDIVLAIINKFYKR